MLKNFTVFCDENKLATYTNKYLLDKSNSTPPLYEFIDQLDDINSLSQYEVFINRNNEATYYYYRFFLENNDFILTAEIIKTPQTNFSEYELEVVMGDISKYVKQNYQSEKESGSIILSLTTFLNSYFAKYEQINQKKQKIDRIKESLNVVKQKVNENFLRIIEREEKITDMTVKVSEVSDHSIAYSRNTTRLRKKFRWERFKSYVYFTASIALILFFLYIVFERNE